MVKRIRSLPALILLLRSYLKNGAAATTTRSHMVTRIMSLAVLSSYSLHLSLFLLKRN